MRLRVILAATALLVPAVAGAGAAIVLSTDEAVNGEPSSALPEKIAEVRQGDLIAQQIVSGTLGYGTPHAVPNTLHGKVTQVVAEGSVIERGHLLYAVNRDPVTLFYGSLPLYRELEYGCGDGPDVKELEANLKALGYGASMTVDDHFSKATAAAVADWQVDRGLDETGAVDDTQVVVRPGPARIQQVSAVVGDTAGKSVVTVTETERLVTIPLDVADQQIAEKGAAVTIELPGDVDAGGTISKVGTVAKTTGDDDNATITIDVEVTLDDPTKAGKFDQAPVSVHLQREARRDVLSVPVQALIALQEGGYGVQLVDGGTVTTLPVKTGLFVAGRVEVSGTGLSEGMTVGVAS